MGKVLVLGFIGALVLMGCGKAGPAGPAGATGPAGAKGDTGASGTSGLTIAGGLTCSKVDSGAGSTQLLIYRTTAFTTGERFVEVEIATTNNYSASAFYRAGISGSVNGTIATSAPLPGDTSGYWIFSLQGGTAKAVYQSSGSPHNNYTYTFVTADCTAF